MGVSNVEPALFLRLVEHLLAREPDAGWSFGEFFEELSEFLIDGWFFYEDHELHQELLDAAISMQGLLNCAEELLALELVGLVHEHGFRVSRGEVDEEWRRAAFSTQVARDAGESERTRSALATSFVGVRMSPSAASWVQRDHLRLVKNRPPATQATRPSCRETLELWVNPRWRRRRVYDDEIETLAHTSWR